MSIRGKLAFLTILFFLCGPLHAQIEVEEELKHQKNNASGAWGNCLTSDLWILSDYSGSMEGYETRVFAAAAEIGNGILEENLRARVGLLLFNDSQYVVQQLTNDKNELNSSLQSYADVGAEGGTQIHRALITTEYLQNHSPKSKYASEADFRKIIILISDGEDNTPSNTLPMAARMKKYGWTIYSIFVHKNDKTPEEARDNGYKHLETISGDSNPGSAYVDSVLLDDLPEYFRQRFSCM